MGANPHVFLTSALRGSESSPLCCTRFTHGEGGPRYSLDSRLDGTQSRSGQNIGHFAQMQSLNPLLPHSIKVNASFCHDDVWGEEAELHALTLDADEWPASRSGCFTPGTCWIGGWVGPEADLEAAAERKFSFPSLAGNRTPVIQPVD
jgi:hypothetical protein